MLWWEQTVHYAELSCVALFGVSWCVASHRCVISNGNLWKRSSVSRISTCLPDCGSAFSALHNICFLTDSCNDKQCCMLTAISPAPLAHTPGLYEMPVTRSQLPIGLLIVRPAISLAASGNVALCSVEHWKRSTNWIHFPFIVVAVFLLGPSLLRVYCG